MLIKINPEACIFSKMKEDIWYCKLTTMKCEETELCPESDKYDEEIDKRAKEKARKQQQISTQ